MVKRAYSEGEEDEDGERILEIEWEWESNDWRVIGKSIETPSLIGDDYNL